MNRNPSKRSSLFLLELMIAILFFCLCSAVCVRLFVESHIISGDTQNLNMAMNETTNLAELFRGEDDYISAMETTYPNGVLSADGNTFTIYYDADWVVCEEKDGQYVVSATMTGRTVDGADVNNSDASSSDANSSNVAVSGIDNSQLIDAAFVATSVNDSKEIYKITTSKYVQDVDSTSGSSVNGTTADNASGSSVNNTTAGNASGSSASEGGE